MRPLILTRHALDLSYEDLPKNAVAVTKNDVLDTLGVITAANSITPEIKELVTLKLYDIQAYCKLEDHAYKYKRR